MRTLDRLKAWVERARDVGFVAIDTETSSLDPMQAELCGFSLAVAPNEACYVPLSHRHGGEGGKDSLFPGEITADQLAEAAALATMKPLLEDAGVLKIGQNLKFDWQIFAVRGIEIKSYDDTMLMSYVVDAGRSDHGLDPLARRYFDHETIDFNEVTKVGKSKLTFDNIDIAKATEYAAEDADATLRLWLVLKPRLAAEHVLDVYETLERPLLRVLADMERRGISIDRQILSRLSGEFAQECGGLQAEINTLAGETVNVGSPKQIGDILFGKLGLEGGTKTKTGQWATGARLLEELAEQGNKLPQKILDWRQVSKLKSTYTDALPGFVNPTTHRVHTSYALASTTTGRLSSSEPNLQNIPIRTEDGRKIRRAFIADARPQARLRRLFADRAAAPCRDRRHRAIAQGVPRRARHPRHDRVGNVRRAGERYAGRGAPPRQGDQFRHHLRHLGVRACQPARHRARGSRRLYQEIFRALPRHSRFHRGDQGVGARRRAM